MFKNNFIDVIKSFDKDELKKFSDFVSSPFHNSNRSVIKLVETLKKYHPEFDNRNFTKEKIFAKVYPTSAYNDQVMRNLMSDALQLALNFLAVKNFTKRKIQSSIYVLEELRNKKLESLYDKNLKNIKKLINDDHSIDFNYFEWLYKAEIENFLNELSFNRQETIYPVVVKQSEYITYDFLSKLINHLIDMDINEQYFSVNGPDVFTKEIFKNINVEKILEVIKDKSEKEYTVLSVFYYRAMTILEGSEKYYRLFKTTFFENISIFSRSVLYNLVTTLETFNINNIKNDPVKFRNELHEIHLKIIENNVLKLEEEAYLSLHRFWNIFINSVEIGKIDWAEDFIKKYYKDIEADSIDGALNFALGIIAYKRKEYGKALELLNKAKLNQYLFKLQIRTFYLRIYFETGDYESAAFALDTYKQFLYKNKKISESYREGYLNFASLYYELMKMKSGESKTGKTDFMQKVDSIPNVYNKQWLMEKLNELS